MLFSELFPIRYLLFPSATGEFEKTDMIELQFNCHSQHSIIEQGESINHIII